MNYYEILGVSRHATLKELTDAKNLLAKKYHPDVTQKSGIDTTEKMQEILEAYTLLIRNPGKNMTRLLSESSESIRLSICIR